MNGEIPKQIQDNLQKQPLTDVDPDRNKWYPYMPIIGSTLAVGGAGLALAVALSHACQPLSNKLQEFSAFFPRVFNGGENIAQCGLSPDHVIQLNTVPPNQDSYGGFSGALIKDTLGTRAKDLTINTVTVRLNRPGSGRPPISVNLITRLETGTHVWFDDFSKTQP